MNLGAIWRLPLIFFCENNQYGLSTAMAYSTAGGSVAERAKSYGVPGIKLDGNDAHAVYQATAEALARARAGDGPTLIEAVTYRWGEHSMRANLPRYRAEAEEAEWRERDPIARLERDLKQRRVVTAAKTKEIHAETEAEVEAAVSFAEASDEPSMAVMTESIYAPRSAAVEPSRQRDRFRKTSVVPSPGRLPGVEDRKSRSPSPSMSTRIPPLVSGRWVVVTSRN